MAAGIVHLRESAAMLVGVRALFGGVHRRETIRGVKIYAPRFSAVTGPGQFLSHCPLHSTYSMNNDDDDIAYSMDFKIFNFDFSLGSFALPTRRRRASPPRIL